MTTRVAFKTCNLCEAMCGLRVEVRAGHVERISADERDPLSKGHICPKAIALKQIQEDPDRLKRPLRRTSSGWREIGWSEALEEAGRRLADIQLEHGDDAVASYLGNPGAHNFGIVMYLVPLYQALGSRNRYSASSLDQNPKHASSLFLFGNWLRIPIPDVDRTDFMLLLGANPVVSGGSLMSAPGFKRRVRALHARGGELVVVDPRRSETAALADEHIALPPGHDALLLAALVHTILSEGLGRDRGLMRFADGRPKLERSLSAFSAERAAEPLGLQPDAIRDLARRFARADRAVCYGRVGTSTQQHGTLANWLVDVMNLVSGNLDHEGGALFPDPAVDLPGLAHARGALGSLGEWRTRVRGAPEFGGEQPTACLAEEISTPGDGRVRGLVTVAGNPALSAPNSGALEAALESLEFHVAIDFYLNETTRHADLILPPTWSLEHDNYEALFHGLAVRNTARFSPAVLEPVADARHDWQILLDLAWRIASRKAKGARRALPWLYGRLRHLPTTRRVLDLALRMGPRGDHLLPWRRGLRLADLEQAPHGIDLGALEPRGRAVLDTRDGRIDLAHPVMLDALARLAEAPAPTRPDGTLWLIGRRDVRTNNSWLHNTAMSAKGPDRCTLWMHAEDAAKRHLEAGSRVRVESRVGAVTATLEIREDLMPGVVSLPHGWGHDRPGMRLSVASTRPGVNCNVLTDDAVLEPIVGNAVFSGVPVRVAACPPGEEAPRT
jgi:anaerobic selenocysteine-containing dehydrogenase